MSRLAELEAEAPAVLAPLALGLVLGRVRRLVSTAADTDAGQLATGGLIVLGCCAGWVGLTWLQADLLLLAGACAAAVAVLVLA